MKISGDYKNLRLFASLAANKNMKIIQLITELYPAGAEKVLLNLSRELKKRGHDISVISLQPLPTVQTDIVDDLRVADIPVTSLNVTKFTPWRIFRLIKLLKQNLNAISGTLGADSTKQIHNSTDTLDKQINNSTNKQINKINNSSLIINNPNQSNTQHSTFNIQHSKLLLHSHLIHANLLSRIASLFTGKSKIKVINTIHIAEKRKSKWWHFFLDKLTFKLCDIQTAVSEAAQQHHAQRMGIKTEQIPVIYNGIVPPKQLTEQEINNLKREWKLDKCDKIIGSVGRLDWQKGYDIFLKNLPELSKKIPSEEIWGIVILGEGGQRPFLQKLINEIDCDNIKIILPGYRKDAADCIAAFNLFFMPSRYEGHPLTLLEAMSHGVPIVANDISTITPIMNNYSNGITLNFETDKIVNSILKSSIYKKQKPYVPLTIEHMTNKYCKLYS